MVESPQEALLNRGEPRVTSPPNRPLLRSLWAAPLRAAHRSRSGGRAGIYGALLGSWGARRLPTAAGVCGGKEGALAGPSAASRPGFSSRPSLCSV